MYADQITAFLKETYGDQDVYPIYFFPVSLSVSQAFHTFEGDLGKVSAWWEDFRKVYRDYRDLRQAREAVEAPSGSTTTHQSDVPAN